MESNSTKLQTTTPTKITPDATSTSTATAAPTKEATITALPTYSSEIAAEQFTMWFNQDKNCKLPCIIGITPGETSFADAANIISQYGINTYITIEGKEISTTTYFPNFENEIHRVDLSFYKSSEGVISRIRILGGVKPQNGNANYEEPQYQRFWHRFFIPEILNTYGNPQFIYLDTTLQSAHLETSYPFALWLVYPQYGFYLRYEGWNSKNKDIIVICPNQSEIEIRIWDKKYFDHDFFLKDDSVLAKPFALGPQPIETVTSFTKDTFIEKFRTSNVDTCFETPAANWPPNKP